MNGKSVPETAGGGSLSRSGRGWWRKLLASLVVGLVFVWLLRAGALPVWPAAEPLSRISIAHALAAAAAWTLMLFIRAVRWHLLVLSVQVVPARAVLSVGLLGFAATLLLPLRSGEVVRPLLIRREGVNAWAATGTVGAERVLDGLCISLLLLSALALSPPRALDASGVSGLGLDAALISGAAQAAAVLFAVAFAALVLFFRFRTLPRRLLTLLLGRFRPAAANAIASRVELVAGGIGFLARPRIAIPFVIATAVYWGLNIFGLWVLTVGAGLTSFSAFQACAVMGVLAIGIMPPGAPGLFGSFQFALYAGLSLYFPRGVLESEGAVVVFLMYVIQVLLTLFGGALGLAYILRTRKAAGTLAESQSVG